MVREAYKENDEIAQKKLENAAGFIGVKSENGSVTSPGRENTMWKGLTVICQPPQAEMRFSNRGVSQCAQFIQQKPAHFLCWVSHQIG